MGKKTIDKNLEDTHNRIIEFYNDDKNYFNKIKNRKVEVYRAILASLEIFKNKSLSVLDVGCGTGNLLNLIYDKGFKNIEGIDNSEKFINEAKKNKKIRYYQGDILTYNIKKKYNIIILTEVLEHSIYPDKIINKCESLLKKEGLIIIQGPNLLQIINNKHIKFENILLSIKKIFQYLINSNITPDYKNPQLDKDTYKTADIDACYLINPFDLKYFIKRKKFTILFASTSYNPEKKYSNFERKLVYLIDKVPILNHFGGSLLIIASKDKLKGKILSKKLVDKINLVY